MARMPGARWLGEHSPQVPMTRHDIVCVHTIVGFAPAHAAHFSVHADGTIDQSRDTRFRSAANLDGNHRVIAIENEDGGEWWEPLTDAQVEANARILRWAHETHGVPLQLCPDSRPTSRGLAYHRQGIDGNFGDLDFPGRVPGGEEWSLTFGKVCPGDRRIAQRPRILDLARNTGDDMTPAESRMLEEIHDVVLASRERERALRANLNEAIRKLDRLEAEVADNATKPQVRRVRDELAALLAEGEA